MKSIVQADLSRCYVCGCSQGLEIHHVMSGVANRPLSTKYTLLVALCAEHHRGKTGVHQNFELKLSIVQDAQKAFERLYGHELWMKTFQKNYL